MNGTTGTEWVVDDLGVIGRGGANYDHVSGIIARHPVTDDEYIIHTTFARGFVAINPRTRTSVHVLPESCITERSAVQGPGGRIYQISGGTLVAWDWKDACSRPVVDFPPPLAGAAYVDFDACGRAYLWGYHSPLWKLDLHTLAVEVLADAGAAVCNRRDGCVYILSGGEITWYDPATGARRPVAMEDGSPCKGGPVLKDGAGRCIIPRDMKTHAGRTWWLELVGPTACLTDASHVRLARTIVANTDVGQVEPWQAYLSPYVLADGSYVSRVVGREMTIVDAAGRMRTFTYEAKELPLRLFSTEAGGGRIWVGSILPLCLLSHNPRSGATENHGTPTPSAGEIYSMVWSQGRLFYASYPAAFVSRYDPSRPWRFDDTVQANPRQFGMMKDPGGTGAVHRPQGKAIDPRGNVYFAALGDYGCPDSAVCRIDVETEQVRRWVLPDMITGAIGYVASTDQLVVVASPGAGGPAGLGARGLMFLLICPETGRVQWSEVMIRDSGTVNAWLHVEGDIVYGLHDYRATLFAFDVKQGKIVAERRELGLGDHLWNALWKGADGRIWGLTRTCCFAAERDLSNVEVIARYTPFSAGGYSAFGIGITDDGSVYFPDGEHLRRLRPVPQRRRDQ